MKVKVKFNLVDNLYLTALGKGMSLTLKHFFLRPTTIQYPEEKLEVYPRFRGAQRLKEDEQGRPCCVACELCATVCPSNAIRVVAAESDDPEVEKFPKEYEIDMLRCVFCGFCVEACPKDAIEMTQQYELAQVSREDALHIKDRLLDRLPERGAAEPEGTELPPPVGGENRMKGSWARKRNRA